MKALSEYFPWYNSSTQGKNKISELSISEDTPFIETAQILKLI
jgi:hypothetical protein